MIVYNACLHLDEIIMRAANRVYYGNLWRGRGHMHGADCGMRVFVADDRRQTLTDHRQTRTTAGR